MPVRIFRGITKTIILEEQEKQFTPEKKQKLLKRYSLFFLITFLLVGFFWIGYRSGQKSITNSKQETFLVTSTEIDNKFPAKKNKIDFNIFWKVWGLLEEKYVGRQSLDAQKLIYGAISGMLKATEDPYTTFFNPRETKMFSQDIGGSFEGIGVELGIKDNILTVIAPLDGSPAEKAGLRAGDKIVKINNNSTVDITIDQAIDLIRGKSGTEINLSVFHKDDTEVREIKIIRNTIKVKSIKLEIKNNKIAYLKISQFGEKTDAEFDLAMNQIISSNSNVIVLDLRNNPGGFLDTAVDIASRMIPKGEVVVTEESGNGERYNLYTSGGDKLSVIPAVVLINEGSASAAEILAGALRDNRNIQLVGKKTFGKGSVQELIKLADKSSVKITVAKWLTPKGEYIMEKGIGPDIEIELTLEDFKNNKDPQLDRALEIAQEMIK